MNFSRGGIGLADDSFAVDVEPDDLEFPHVDLLRASAKPDSEAHYFVIRP